MTKAKAAKRARRSKEVRPPVYERLKKGLDDLRRHFEGEDVGVVTTVYVAPGAAAECIRTLKDARTAAGLTLKAVATRSGLRVETLSRMELGKVPNPTVDTLNRYAAAVGYTLSLSAVPLRPGKAV
jgi:DNA-binding XRE family transcriptional regulator